MTRRDLAPDRERPRAQRPAAPALEPNVLARVMLGVQRTAGNQAATRLARSAVAAPAHAAAGHEIGRIASAGDELLERWEELETPQRRAKVLVRTAAEQLREMDVPPFEHSLERAPGEGELDAPAGVFRFEVWTMHVEARRFEGPPDYAAVRALAMTVAHETRHCQQWFAMARYLAGSEPDLDAAGIAERMKIPRRIAARAHGAPVRDGDAGFADAQVWYESVYGAGAEHRRDVLLNLDAAEVWYRVAKAKLDRASPAERPAAQREFAAAQKELHKWFAEYEQLATEADARAVGKRVGLSLDKLRTRPRP